MKHSHVRNINACPSDSNIYTWAQSFAHSCPLTLLKICGTIQSTHNHMGPITSWKTKPCDFVKVLQQYYSIFLKSL